MNRTLLAAGVLGATAVALGAYGAHGLESRLASHGYEGDALDARVENFLTGTRYQLHAAAALLAIGVASDALRRRLAWPASLLTGGAIVFSGLLYALALVEGMRWLGAIVPLGGLAMIAAWVGVAAAGCFVRDEDSAATPDAELVRLEELLTHQQRLLTDLDEAVTEARRESDAVRPRLARVEQAARRLVELQEGAEDLPDERPPHY